MIAAGKPVRMQRGNEDRKKNRPTTKRTNLRACTTRNAKTANVTKRKKTGDDLI